MMDNIIKGKGPQGGLCLVLDFPNPSNYLRHTHFYGKEITFIESILKGVGGTTLDKVYVTYSIPYTPKTGKPTQEDIQNNHERLLKELEKQKVKKVLLLGSYARAVAFNTKVEPLNSTRGLGQWIELETGQVYSVTTVPIYYMTTGETGSDNFRDFIYDFCKFIENTAPYPSITNDQILLETPQELEKYLSLLTKATTLSCDIETTGLNPLTDEIDSIGFGSLYTVPKKTGERGLTVLLSRHLVRDIRVKPILIDFFTNFKGTFVFHNGKFDLKFLSIYLGHPIHYGINLKDTMFLNYLLDERPLNSASKPHGLKAISRVRFDIQNYKFDFKKFWSIPVEERDWESFYYYLSQDLMYTLLLVGILEKELEEDNPKGFKVLNELLYPATKAFVDIELGGVLIDITYLESQEKVVNSKLNEYLGIMKGVLENKGIHLSDSEFYNNFNPSSPVQTCKAIYDILGAKVLGKRSSDKVLLFSVMENHRGTLIEEFCEALLSYREYSKVLGTYIHGLIKMAGEDNRIRGQFNLIGTATGRLSSSDPNLQNIPTMMGPMIRQGFIPKPGHILAELDYSQLELRIAANYSKDPIMVRAYVDNRDIHKEVASAAFQVPYEDVNYYQRYSAKLIVFGMLYGRGANSLAVGSRFEHYHWTVEEAQKFIDDFLNTFTGLKNWIESQHKFVEDHHYIEMPTGRRRRWQYIPAGGLAQIHRQSVNSPIQGLASDFTLTTIIKAHKWLREEKLGTKIVSTVHDSILYEIPLPELDYVIPKLKTLMATNLPVDPIVPIVVDSEVGFNWGELEEWGEGKILLGYDTQDSMWVIWDNDYNAFGFIHGPFTTEEARKSKYWGKV